MSTVNFLTFRGTKSNWVLFHLHHILRCTHEKQIKCQIEINFVIFFKCFLQY
uniref:CSON003969 protein n=1 Tax=Culicoides sonorensis TaxID=179676 RepID=A0A336MRF0_CULSO